MHRVWHSETPQRFAAGRKRHVVMAGQRGPTCEQPVSFCDAQAGGSAIAHRNQFIKFSNLNIYFLLQSSFSFSISH